MGGRLGLSSHLEWGDSASDTSYRAFEEQAWKDLGVGMVRRDLTWSLLEPAPGEFDFDGADRLMESVESVEAEFLALLDYGNPWAAGDVSSDKVPPDDPETFGDYAAAVASHYGDRVSHYEVWNEPNNGLTFWQPVEDPAAYGALLVEASQRLKETNAQALVSFGGIFWPDLLVNTPGADFVRDVAEAVPDVWDHVDSFSLHPYRYPFTEPEDGETQDALLTTLCETQDLLAELGAPGLPIWLTELGWHTAPEAFVAGGTEHEQAAWLARSALLSLSHGVEWFLWYTFRDLGPDLDDQEQAFGLYGWDEDPTSGPDAEPKLAVAAFSSLVEILGDHVHIEDVSELLGFGEDSYGYRLSGGEGETWVLWTVAAPYTVQVPGEEDGTLVALDGTRGESRSKRGAHVVTLSDRPVALQLP